MPVSVPWAGPVTTDQSVSASPSGSEPLSVTAAGVSTGVAMVFGSAVGGWFCRIV